MPDPVREPAGEGTGNIAILVGAAPGRRELMRGRTWGVLRSCSREPSMGSAIQPSSFFATSESPPPGLCVSPRAPARAFSAEISASKMCSLVSAAEPRRKLDPRCSFSKAMNQRDEATLTLAAFVPLPFPQTRSRAPPPATLRTRGRQQTDRVRRARRASTHSASPASQSGPPKRSGDAQGRS